MFERLIMHWVYGGALAGILLLIMFPLLTSSWSVPLTLTFFHLPMYMLHQYEEHDKDQKRPMQPLLLWPQPIICKPNIF